MFSLVFYIRFGEGMGLYRKGEDSIRLHLKESRINRDFPKKALKMSSDILEKPLKKNKKERKNQSLFRVVTCSILFSNFSP